MTFDFRAIARATITRSEALAIFGLSGAIGLHELKLLYRKKSLESHEDYSGSKVQSQKLNEAYDILRGVAVPKPEPTSYDYRGGPEPGWGKPPPGPSRDRTDDERRRRQERQDADDRERARAQAEKRRKEEEARKREEESRAKPKPPVSTRSVPRDVVERARTRMYDAYDRAPGDASNKFNKMLMALKTRLRAITDPSKREGVLEMLRQETEDPHYMKRWSQSEIAIMKQVLEILSR